MAKKKKKKASIDVNETIMNDMNPVVSSDDKEFENLLNSFIQAESDEKAPQEEVKEEAPQEEVQPAEENFEDVPTFALREEIATLDLGNDERELAGAYANFLEEIQNIAQAKNLPLPDFMFDPERMIPNYKPSTGRRISEDLTICWGLMLTAYPDKFKDLDPNAGDEAFLSFAETIGNQSLQLAVISYVEILIDLENCEISYEEKRLKAQRRRVEKALYEEYQRRQERKQRFIEAVIERGFPVNAERLINNYFKTASKDEEGAYEVLTKNPAVYAPIEVDKIKPRLFGLIKPTPQDGIRENKRLGDFLKKLKA